MILILAAALVAVVVALLALARRSGSAVVSWALRIVAAVVAPPLLLVLAVVLARVRNDRRLARFAEQLDRFPPPASAHVVHRLADVGLLAGNGNHCDFLVRHEITSALPLASVRAHYARLRLRPAIPEVAGDALLEVFVEPRTGGGYIVTALDASYPDGFDDRCT